MIDKEFCMSSYLAFRYIEKDDVDFYEGLSHNNIELTSDKDRIRVNSSEDIDRELKKVFEKIKYEKLGILLSGGMDSGILASYMTGATAYTFRFLNGTFRSEELKRAEYYADHYGLKLEYVDINWNCVENNLDKIMMSKGAPVHSIEPQIHCAAMQAKKDGIQRMIIGNSADLIFGGMDKLLSEDWEFDKFVERYMFTNPKKVLKKPKEITYLFERFRKGKKIDYLSFMDKVSLVESLSSYMNAFKMAGMPYTDPYEGLKMASKLDLVRIRNGESKYLIRELFKMKYPDINVPEKIPMPRPVDSYFKKWNGPKRKEFRDDINIEEYDGNQRWQLYCLERFLNLYE